MGNWISEVSGWVTESMDGEYANVSIYCPLSGSSYIELPDIFRISKTFWSILKIDDNKCFLWCDIRHLNSLQAHPERITKADRRMISSFDYDDIRFLVSKKDYGKNKKKNSINIKVFSYKNALVYPVHASDK